MANVILDGVTYNGVDKVSLKDADNLGQRVEFQSPPTLVTKNITANGTYAASSDNADGYSSVTVNVQQETVVEKDVNFYDYDGTLVASYTAADFANLTAMPANPSHTGLVAEGWNWTLSDAKSYVASYGMLDIGQMYHTASGKTEYDIEVNEATGFTATLGLSGTEKDWGDGTTDTLETHTYATAGNYTIKLSGTTLPSVQNSKKLLAVRLVKNAISVSNLFFGCRRLKTISIPSGIITLYSGFYGQCRSLSCIILPDTCTGLYDQLNESSMSIISLSKQTSLTSNSFYGNPSIKKIAIANVGSIPFASFTNCYALSKITIPNTITNIGGSAFGSCYSLQSVTIPSSVTSIGNFAFSNCSWLTIVTVLATTPPTVSSNSFPSNVTKIYIPHGTLATYTAETNWSTYASKLVELPA